MTRTTAGHSSWHGSMSMAWPAPQAIVVAHSNRLLWPTPQAYTVCCTAEAGSRGGKAAVGSADMRFLEVRTAEFNEARAARRGAERRCRAEAAAAREKAEDQARRAAAARRIAEVRVFYIPSSAYKLIRIVSFYPVD